MVGEVRACLARVGAQRGMIGNSSSNQCRAVFMTPEPGFGGEERMGEAGGRRFKLQEGIVALALGLQVTGGGHFHFALSCRRGYDQSCPTSHPLTAKANCNRHWARWCPPSPPISDGRAEFLDLKKSSRSCEADRRGGCEMSGPDLQRAAETRWIAELQSVDAGK
jgi:hypothetical protein